MWFLWCSSLRLKGDDVNVMPKLENKLMQEVFPEEILNSDNPGIKHLIRQTNIENEKQKDQFLVTQAKQKVIMDELAKQKKTRAKLDKHTRSNAMKVDQDLGVPAYIKKFTVTHGASDSGVKLVKEFHCPDCKKMSTIDQAFEVTFKMLIADHKQRLRIKARAKTYKSRYRSVAVSQTRRSSLYSPFKSVESLNKDRMLLQSPEAS